jgi:hypothetical protein
MDSNNKQAEKEQLEAAIDAYGGWFAVLRELTPLTKALDNFKAGQGKNGVRLAEKAHDISPCCPSSKGKIFHMTANGDITGYGHCWKCGENHSPLDIIMKFNGWSIGDAFKEVKQTVGFQFNKNYTPTPRKQRVVNNEPTERELNYAKWCKDMMNKAWSEGIDLDHAQAIPFHRYCLRRGISNAALLKGQGRLHLKMPYIIQFDEPKSRDDDDTVAERNELIEYAQQHSCFVSFSYYPSGEIKSANMGTHPCLMLLIRHPETGEPRRIHRIYLTEDGHKIDFDNHPLLSAKMMMTGGVGCEVTGCSVLIDPAGTPVIGVAEGLETALAVKFATGMPMQCTINAGLLGNWIAVSGTKVVVIWEDKDRSKTGEKMADKLEESLVEQGIRVIRMVPPLDLNGKKSVDWLDVLVRLGEMAFPAPMRNWDRLLAA